MRRLNISEKLTFFFLLAALLVGLVSFVAIHQMKEMERPLTVDIPNELREIERTSILDGLSQQIREHDHIMMESVRDYVGSGNKRWKFRYQTAGVKMDMMIQQAVETGDEVDKRIFSKIRSSREVMLRIEADAIKRFEDGFKDQSVQMLERLDYWEEKNRFRQGLEDYAENRGRKYGQRMAVTATNINWIISQTRIKSGQAREMFVSLCLLTLVLAIMAGFLITRSITRPLEALKKGTFLMGQGDMEYKIPVYSEDELGQLAKEFNQMRSKLKAFQDGQEKVIGLKTRELATKYQEIQRKNHYLQESRNQTLDALKNLEITRSNLEREKVRFETLLASIGDGLIVIDPMQRVGFMNAQASRLLGAEDSDYMGVKIEKMMHFRTHDDQPFTKDEDPISRVLRESKRLSVQVRIVKKNHEQFHATMTVAPIIFRGNITGVIAVFRDATHEYEASRRKSEFVATVSHELKTPLTVLNEAIALLSEGLLGPVTSEQIRILNMSLEDVHRMRRMIDDLLDLAKLESGQMEISRAETDLVALAKSIGEYYEKMFREKGLDFQLEVSDEEIQAYVDADKLKQVFLNLVGNALKFTEEGFIRIEIREEEDSFVCSIKDTGPGIREEDMDRVFGRFQQFSQEPEKQSMGSGLGLSITKGIIELHGGEIKVQSQWGKGMNLSFVLPKISLEESFAVEIQKIIPIAERTGMSILALSIIIDGEPEREAVNLMFKEFPQIIRKDCRVPMHMTLRGPDRLFMICGLPAEAVLNNTLETLRDRLRELTYVDGGEALMNEGFRIQMIRYPDQGKDINSLLRQNGMLAKL